MRQIYKDELNSGVTVITERKPYYGSMSIGFWVKTGSVYEPSSLNGISHFIEHMLFKGTKTRSYLDIDKEIDIMGGALNAFTSNEITCFYTKVIAKNYERAIDLLADIMFNSLFSEKEIEKEKLVILQEIMGVQDDPYDHVQDLFHKDFYGCSPIGSPILGTEESVRSFNRDMIIQYFKDHYIPNNMIISIAGNINHKNVVSLIEKYIKKFYIKRKDLKYNIYSGSKISKHYGEYPHNKDLEQTHFIIGLNGIKRSDDDYYTMEVFNTILGGSVSSRLFQEVREKKGLAYSIYSNNVFHRFDGYVSIYAGVSPDKLNIAKDVIYNIVNSFVEGKVDYEDLSNAKKHVSDGFLLGLESTSNLMTRNALNEIYHGRYISKMEVLKKIDAVNEKTILNLSKKLFSDKNKRTITILGRTNS
jgi:predicted Zn-dependent peptidase